MKKFLKVLFPLITILFVFTACGNKQDIKEFEEIAEYYKENLRNSDKDIKLKIYASSDDENTYYIERYNPKRNKDYRSLWDRKEKKKDGNIDQTTDNELYRKFVEQGEKVYETTISYDK